MRFTITVTRQGVPLEEWEAETDTQEQAVAGCRQQRQRDGEHWPSDTYDAEPSEDIDDAQALEFARAHAAKVLPELHRFTERATIVQAHVPAWLGVDAAPLMIGGLP